jgi:hypothetical protein
MLRSLTNLRNFRIHAFDGEIGVVQDVLFDDSGWVVRYLVIDTSLWLPDRKVLISPRSVGRAAWAARQLRVLLTRDQIRDAPSANGDSSVARWEEERLAEYYAWPKYWSMPDSGQGLRESPSELQSRNSNLHSVRETTGYGIEAHNGSIGHVEDFVGDDSDWVIRYMVLDARNARPAKRALVPAACIDDLDSNAAHVRVGLDNDTIAEAPAFDPDEPIDREYVTRLRHYYDRRGRSRGMPTDTEK